MKIIKNYLMSFGIIAITLGLSCNKDIINEGMYKDNVPSQFIEINAKIERIILENKSVIPAKINPIILWETAIIDDNQIEVEIKNDDNTMLIPSRVMESGIKKFGKLILKIDDINNPSDLLVYGIIPDNKSFLLNRKLKIDDLKDPGFNGMFWVSDLSFKPFRVFEYKNGKLDKKLKLLKKDESEGRIEKRDYWLCDYVALVQIGWDYETGEWVVAGDPIGEWYIDCEFVDEGETENEGDDCTKYPWLCDDDGSHYGDDNSAGGGDDVEDEEAIVCECTGSTYQKIYLVGWDYPLFGFTRHYLEISQADCETGKYIDHHYHTKDGINIDPKFDCSGYQLRNYSFTRYNKNGKPDKCNYRVIYHYIVNETVTIKIDDYSFNINNNDDHKITFEIL